jgi:hypothetical protein
MGTRSLHTPEYRRMCLLLRSVREKAGLSTRDLGAKLDRPYSYVSKTERAERRMDPVEFIDWCRACRTDPRKAIATLCRKSKR